MSACCPAPILADPAVALDRWVIRPSAGLAHLDLLVPGVHCVACIRSIERAVLTLPGVSAARVNLTTRRLAVDWRDGTLEPADIVAAVAGAGYDAKPFHPREAGESDAEGRELLQSLAVAGFAAANVMLLSVSVWSGAESATRDLFHWISALIALPAVAYAGRPFFRSAWRVLRTGHTNMDVPISLGVLLACAMSLFETIHSGDHAYFDAAVALLFFLLTGRYLEHLMRQRARSAVTHLLALSATGATVIADDGRRMYLPVEELAPGMTVAVAAGERIPADGIVIAGGSDIDTAPLTGEPVPQSVREGALVHSGTVNLTGPLTIQVKAAGESTLLAEIVRMMEAAEQGRTRYVDLAQRLARYYAPIVHVLAATTFAGWMWVTGDWHQALAAAVAVLIITCPCALGLAVPAVQVVASGALFRRGILLTSGTALERLAEIDRVAFDKTGTLTFGRPKLVQAAIDMRALSVAAGLATASNHPLSRAIAAFADERGVAAATLSDIREHPGLGIEGMLNGRAARLGSRRWCGPEEEAGASDFIEVWLDVEDRAPIRFCFEDAPRPDAAETVAALRERGCRSEILSGGRDQPVGRLADQLEIPGYLADLLPAQKAARLEVLRDCGHRVLMVGDGINDAPALATAHVSIAPASAADIGRAAADFVFTGEALGPIVEAYDIAVKARQLMIQNFMLAIGYNVLAVPLAILGHATPLIAAVAMSTSSIIVITNALRLGLPGKPSRAATAETGPAGQAGTDMRIAA